MSSLTDRLAAASRDRVSTTVVKPTPGASPNPRKPAPSGPTSDRLSTLKSQVHSNLLQQLGPKLYDADLAQAELEQMVRAALQDAMSAS